MFILYNLLMTLLAPFWLPWMYWRTRQRAEPVNWKERAGEYTIPKRGEKRRIWVHAVSVGEVLASTPVLRAIREELPNHEIVLSVTTSSGHQTAREKAADLFDHLIYFPIDIPRFTLRAIQSVRPDVVAIMETELWFNFLWAAQTFDARTILVNGRISDRNIKRSKYLVFFYKSLLKQLDRTLMQTKADADRITFLGAQNAEVIGNCKFDQAAEGLDADPEKWRRELKLEPGRPVVVVGSLRAEEFEFLAATIKAVPEPHWIVAPRHLEKTPGLIEAIGGPVASRTEKTTGDVIVLDTYGELANVYSTADVVVVGGGFGKWGGQNPIQPLAQGKPILFGPYMQNFRDAAAMAVEAGAGQVCASPEELALAIKELLNDPKKRKEIGDNARRLVDQNVGASRRYAKVIAEETAKVKD